LLIAIGLLLAGALQVPGAPDCSPPDWGGKVTRFDAQMAAYAELRGGLEQGMPSRIVVAQRIRMARAQAKQGDIFTPDISVDFKRALAREMNAHTWKVIMDDNPGEMLAPVNGFYPEGKPLSTMPPNVLAALPKLPQDVEYRFVERHLILLDTRTKLILDRIPYAIRATETEPVCR
jgi:hypothetical protein